MQCTNSPMSRKDIEYEKIGKSCSGTAQSNISYFILTICYQYSRFTVSFLFWQMFVSARRKFNSINSNLIIGLFGLAGYGWFDFNFSCQLKLHER